MRTRRSKFIKRRIFAVFAISFIISFLIFIYLFESNKLFQTVTVEAVNNTLDTSVNEKKYSSQLEIKNTVAPVAELITVQVDTEPPKIEGAHDQTIYIGDTIAYKKDITVTDNRDNNVKLEVNSSAVNSKKSGTYNVIYKATDNSGNVATKTVTLKVIERPIVAITATKDDLDSLADTVLATIITNDMSKVQKAKAIYDWTKHHISYVDNSDKSDWVKAAIQGIKKGSGDCFVYFSTSQELLTRAGIENQEVIKTTGNHYWSLINCGEGWYHFDTTPRFGGGEFFMLTDAQIEEYSKKHDDSHVWDKTKYPATPL